MKTAKITAQGLLMWAIGVCLFTGASIAVMPDIGMVTRLEGNVTFWNDTDNHAHQTAQNFMKVRSGDRFELEAGARLQLVFFASGRRELWTGPSSLKMTGSGSDLIAGGKAPSPQVTLLPETVSREMLRISPLIAPEKLQRSGATTVRGKRTDPRGYPRNRPF